MDADRQIQTIAARQHGVVTRAQLIASGLPRCVIEYRVKRQRLEPLHRGVYRTGPVRSEFEPEMAAVLACGATAVLSYSSAAVLWEFTGMAGAARSARAAPPRSVHVSIHGGSGARVRGVVVHRVSALHAEEVTELQHLPVTSAERTLLDLAPSWDERALERVLADAQRRGVVDANKLRRLLSLRPHRRGAAKCRRLLGAREPQLTRSEAESRFLALIRRSGLQSPEANVRVRGFEVDFLWRAERLVVEIDGFAFHASAAAFERDRQRDATLTAAGLRVMRATWRQLTETPEALLVRVAQSLARGQGPA